jgi:hypothetical protein
MTAPATCGSMVVSLQDYPNMELIYQFTEDERRVIAAAFNRYLQVVQVIAELHQIQGTISVASDLSGFVQQKES